MSKLIYIKETYLKNDLKVFPVIENKKVPLIDKWQEDCSSDFLQVAYWLENAPNCNIGLPANKNDLFIIDVDMHNGVNGLESYNNLLHDLGLTIDDCLTWQQKTPSGGIHFIFKSDEELQKVTNSANCFDRYPGIDIRTNGYILVEPSEIDGVPYKLDNESIKDMPKQLRDYILSNSEKLIEEKQEYVKPSKVLRGGRDTSLFEYLNQLYYKTRLDKEEILLLGYFFNETVCSPPLSKGVVEYKVNKLFKKKRNEYIILRLGEENSLIDEN